MYSGGYTGRILRIDLTRKAFGVEALSSDTARHYLGGAGFAIRTLFDEVAPRTDALGPLNKLVFAVGPLTGTTVPCASRMVVAAKSPLTGAVGVALTGGYFPAELKFAGYDMVIVEGRAQKPTYLWIGDGKVRFRSAAKAWGSRTGDCQQILKDAIGDQGARIACIGPAGERLSRMACIVNEKRAAGRKGLGAVMGSKNLKAVVVRGDTPVAVADAAQLKAARSAMLKAMRESPVLFSMFSRYGTPMVVDHTCHMGIFPAKNWTATGDFAPSDQIGVAVQERTKVGSGHCFNCPVGCTQFKLVRSGRHAGVLGEPEFETYYALGGQTGVDDHDAIVAADRLCDELGLDTISAGVTVGFAMELAQRGILDRAETNGRQLAFGDADAMLELIRKMAFREGLGDLLADGVRSAAERIGGDAGRYALHVKGLELPGYDVRGAKAHALNYATAYTGGDHNRGYAFQEIFGVPVPEPVDRFAVEGKGRLTAWNQDMRTATCDCPTLCAFLLDMAVPETAAGNTARLLSAATGIGFTPDEIVTAGERVNNLAKAFNVREGFTRSDDTLPRRLMTEAIGSGASKGHRIPREDLDRMLDEYYTHRGWDPRTGVPTRQKLQSLGLADVADRLRLSSAEPRPFTPPYGSVRL